VRRDHGGLPYGEWATKAVSLARGAICVCAALSSSRPAHAAPPDPNLLARLAQNEQEIEMTARRANYRAEEVVQQIDRHGKVSSTKTLRYRIESNGTTRHKIVESAVEDGKDVTFDEQQKARKNEAERVRKKRDDMAWPFAPGSAARYTYNQIATDPTRPYYVEIAFAPKNPDSHTFEGTAWVDAAKGQIMSAGLRLSKPPTLVDWVHLTAEFGSTPAGSALSRISVEGAGGLLFLHKHFRSRIKMTDWRLAR